MQANVQKAIHGRVAGKDPDSRKRQGRLFVCLLNAGDRVNDNIVYYHEQVEETNCENVPRRSDAPESDHH